MSPAMEKALLEDRLGFPFSTDDEGQLVFHGRTRDVVIRRVPVTFFQVDEIRFSHPDDAINAAIRLITDETGEAA
jgi:hypothetical protein